jgi:4-amino-4-deoxy-L-arabinose transferase-like glycosyltransferase
MTSQLKFLLFFTLLFLLFFYYYYSQRNTPIRIWDEAIYSNNAIEMAQSHNYFIVTNNGQPSYYNTKPPMAIWFQSIAINLFGINEFAIRFPSMLSALATMLGLIYFLNRNRFPLVVQFTCIFTLLTSPGYMGTHVAATGDLDALLTMWTTFFSLVIFDILLNGPQFISKKVWLAGGFFLCAFFTKSTAAFLILPGILLVLIVSGNLGLILRNKHTYIVALFCLILITAWYTEVNNSVRGYFENAWNSEVKRFYSNIMPWHNHAWFFYFQNLLHRFWFWIFLLLPSLIFLFLSNNHVQKKIFLAALIYGFTFLLLISIPSVKLEHYDAQVYPFLSLVIAIALNGVYTYMKSKLKPDFVHAFTGLLALVYVCLFVRIINIQKHITLLPQEVEGSFAKNVFKDLRPKHSKVLMTADHSEHFDQLNFYRKKFKSEFQSDLVIVARASQVTINDTVFVCQKSGKDALHHLFDVDTLKKENECLLVKIISKKR